MRVAPFLLVLLVACSGETGAPQPEPEPEPEPERPRFIEAIARPPALGHEATAQLRDDLLETIDTDLIPEEPSVTSPGLPIAENSELRVVPVAEIDRYTLRGELREVEGRAVTGERLLRAEPTAVLGDAGEVVVRFETLRPVPGAAAFFGTIVPEDVLGTPRLRKRSRRLSHEGNVYEIRFDLRRILKEKYDVRNTGRTGRGILAWRLEILDDAFGSSRVYDGELPYRCEPRPCLDETTVFHQLPSIRLGPFVDQVGTDTATISFDTNAATAAFIALYPEGREPELLESEAPGVHHEIGLEGLDANTRYRYQPVVVDRRGEIDVHRGGTFETRPREIGPFEAVFLSDSRSGHGAADEHYAGTNGRVLRGLLNQAAQGDPRFVVFVGDLIDGYTTWPGSYRHEIEAWKKVVQPWAAHLPIYEVMGNHEALIDLWAAGWAVGRTDPSAEALFAEAFVNPTNGPEPAEGAPPYAENTYSFGYGNAHFAVVNSNYWYRSHAEREEHPGGDGGQREGFLNEATLEWLDQDLAAARERGARHLFVFTHEPGFPNGGHVKDGMWWHGRFDDVNAMRTRLYGILGRHRVAAIVHGDEHNYSRTRIDGDQVEGLEHTIWQLVSGGAGAPYYAQERDVPWASAVEVFDPRQHFLRLRIDGDSASITAVSMYGETIDSFEIH